MARKPTPQEAELYKKIVTMALKYLFDPAQANSIKQIASNSDPAEALAAIVSMTMKNMQTAGENAEVPIDYRYIYPAAAEITKQLCEMLVVFGVVKEQEVEQVFRKAMQIFADATRGKLMGGQKQPQQQPVPQGGMIAQGA